MNYTTIGGRRFLLTCSTQIISSVLLWYGHLSSEAYSMIILGTVAAYIAGGTYQTVKKDA
jgi:hypothetical protein